MIEKTMTLLGQNARRAARKLAMTDGAQRNEALKAAASAIRRRCDKILAANAVDMGDGDKRGLSAAMLDRLMLDASRVEAMAAGIETIIDLPDPVGRVREEWERPNGLRIQRVAVPLGVIGIIYESRPNVTADAAAPASAALRSSPVVVARRAPACRAASPSRVMTAGMSCFSMLIAE